MKTAFFYQQPEALDREIHKHLKLKPLVDVGFAEQSHVVPIVAIEFSEACLEYPIVFNKIEPDNWGALAVTGLADGENLFIDQNKQWAGRYVPACIRRYPYILADNGEQAMGVAIDLACPNVGEQVDGGEALFLSNGEPAPQLQTTMNFLAEFQNQVTVTQALLHRLAEADLLVQSDLKITLSDGRSAGLSGGWIVDENRLKALPDATAAAWFRSGDLAQIYQHLLSLRNLTALLQKRTVAPAIAAPAAAESPAELSAAAASAWDV